MSRLSRPSRLRTVFLGLVLTACTWCGPTLAKELTVSAASSLTEPFREFAKRFEEARPSTSVRLNFGSSGMLATQVDRGAPVDVLATADESSMKVATSRGRIAEQSVHVLAYNQLVLIVPGNAPAQSKPKTLEDLLKPAFGRIAIGKPATVPAGRYAQEAFELKNLWNDLQSRFIYTQNVRHVLDLVARGEVDAGVVYASDARLMHDKVEVVFPLPTRSRVRYVIAPTADSPQASLARDFLNFVRTSTGKKILERHGFQAP